MVIASSDDNREFCGPSRVTCGTSRDGDRNIRDVRGRARRWSRQRPRIRPIRRGRALFAKLAGFMRTDRDVPHIEMVSAMPADEDRNPEPIEAAKASGQAEIARLFDLPTSLRAKGAFDIWGPGGPGPLLRRLNAESVEGNTAYAPLTAGELAQLIELFDGEPLPQSLRSVLLRELRSERRARPGRKVRLSLIQDIERHLLPGVYARGMRAAAWLRPRLVRIEERKPRRATAEPIPTQSQLAMHLVRARLPSMRKLNDKTLANKLSELKDRRDKPAQKRSDSVTDS